MEVGEKMIVPVFYFKKMVMMMAQPTEFMKHKIAIKEHLNQELNEGERKFIKVVRPIYTFTNNLFRKIFKKYRS